jgi:hypothetical protein
LAASSSPSFSSDLCSCANSAGAFLAGAMTPPGLDVNAADVETGSVLYKHCDELLQWCNQRYIGGCLQPGELRNLVSGAGAMQSGPEGAVA